jgi:hypothetical protein
MYVLVALGRAKMDQRFKRRAIYFNVHGCVSPPWTSRGNSKSATPRRTGPLPEVLEVFQP